MAVQFASDGSVNDGGFEATYRWKTPRSPMSPAVLLPFSAVMPTHWRSWVFSAAAHRLSAPSSAAVRPFEPGGCTAFRSHSNSSVLTHPARGQAAVRESYCAVDVSNTDIQDASFYTEDPASL